MGSAGLRRRHGPRPSSGDRGENEKNLGLGLIFGRESGLSVTNLARARQILSNFFGFLNENIAAKGLNWG